MPNLCIDCRHCDNDETLPECFREGRAHLVTGAPVKGLLCQNERYPMRSQMLLDSPCGLEGKYWQARSATPAKD